MNLRVIKNPKITELSKELMRCCNKRDRVSDYIDYKKDVACVLIPQCEFPNLALTFEDVKELDLEMSINTFMESLLQKYDMKIKSIECNIQELLKEEE